MCLSVWDRSLSVNYRFPGKTEKGAATDTNASAVTPLVGIMCNFNRMILWGAFLRFYGVDGVQFAQISSTNILH